MVRSGFKIWFRKYRAFALAMTLITLIPLYLYFRGKSELEAFCDAIPLELPYDGLERKVREAGYSMYNERDFRVRITKPGISLHTPNCMVLFNTQIRTGGKTYNPP